MRLNTYGRLEIGDVPNPALVISTIARELNSSPVMKHAYLFVSSVFVIVIMLTNLHGNPPFVKAPVSVCLFHHYYFYRMIFLFLLKCLQCRHIYSADLRKYTCFDHVKYKSWFFI